MEMRARIISIILVLLPLSGAFAQGAKAFLKEGDAYKKEGQLELALQRYDLAVKVDPRSTKAWTAKAEMNELLGHKQQAASDRRMLAELDPGEPSYSTNAAKAFLELDSGEVALRLLDQALRVNPKYMDALLTKARACLHTGDMDGAMKAADAALAVKATTDTYYVHGLVRSAARDLKTAEFDFEKVLEWNHLYEPAYVALAEVQLRLSEQYSGNTMRMRTLEKAIERCTRAIELNPGSTDALFTRSKGYAAQKEYAKAIDDVSKCIALGRTDVQVYHQRAMYYQGFGQHQNAVNDLNKALLDRPDDVELLLLRAECREANLDMQGALKDLEVALKVMDGKGGSDIAKRDKVAASQQRIAHQIFEMNRESDPPAISVLKPFRKNDVAQVSASIQYVEVSGYVRDKSLLRSITVNGASADFTSDEKDPQFAINIPFEREDSLIIIQAVDVYDNMNSIELSVVRTEGIAPSIAITTPKPSGDRELTISAGKNEVFIEGRIKDASLIRMVSVNGINVSYAPDQLDPDFSIKADVTDRDKLVVRAEDQYGNATETTYKIIRKTEPVVAKAPSDNRSSATGHTWVVHIENSNYRSFPAAPVTPSDVQKMQKAFSSYNVQKTITKKNLSKDQLERFFNIELRDMVRTNNVNTILVWYNGHGRTISGKSYWVPVDGKPDDVHSFYNHGSLKSQLQNYSESVDRTLVISEAIGADPSFYELTR